MAHLPCLSLRAVTAAALVVLAAPSAGAPGDKTPRLVENPLQVSHRERMTQVMEHTDRDWDVRGPRDGGVDTVVCEPGERAKQAERLLKPLLGEPMTEGFVRRWYTAMAVRAHAWGCLAEAQHWAERGLKAAPPDDPELLMVAGAVAELRAALWTPFSPRTVLSQVRPRQRDGMMKAERERQAMLMGARASFQAALRAEASLHEARLRLGRVEWRLGHLEAAREALGAVVASARDERLQYLALLFGGQVEEDLGRLDAAARAYRGALGLRPAAQSAAVALSHVLFLSGHTAAAREALEDALAYAGEPDRRDDLWEYALGNAEHADELMAALRAEARP